MREKNRKPSQLREIQITPNVLKYAEGSCEIVFGNTKVLCAASVEKDVPPFLRDSGKGWVSAEYNMLPRATHTRNKRERNGKVKGRTMEIQRLIARSLRAVIDLEKLGERSIVVDCDVLEADGGTRTASITGAFVALKLAIEGMLATGELTENPIKNFVAAVSVGVLEDDEVVLDLNYEEDSQAKVDMNLVMNDALEFIEIQGTGEEATFTASQLQEMLALGTNGIEQLIQLQKEVFATGAVKKNIETKKMTEKTVVIATRNAGKAREFEKLFSQKGFKIKTLLDYPELPEIQETGMTFEENARLKAEGIAEILQQPVLADDSGLMVDALGGFPGVFSARYSDIPGVRSATDASNNAKLLGDLHSLFVKGEKVSAQFHCTLVFAAPGKESLVVEADWEGEITPLPKGSNGFGYDPIFLVDGLDKTSAELTAEEKNEISHRAKALQKLSLQWEEWLNA